MKGTEIDKGSHGDGARSIQSSSARIFLAFSTMLNSFIGSTDVQVVSMHSDESINRHIFISQFPRRIELEPNHFFEVLHPLFIQGYSGELRNQTLNKNTYSYSLLVSRRKRPLSFIRILPTGIYWHKYVSQR